MSPASQDTHLSKIHKRLIIFYEKPFWVHMGNESDSLREISPWTRRDLSKVQRKYIIWMTNVVHGMEFWFAEMHSLQYRLALSHGSEMNFFPYKTTLIFNPLPTHMNKT